MILIAYNISAHAGTGMSLQDGDGVDRLVDYASHAFANGSAKGSNATDITPHLFKQIKPFIIFMYTVVCLMAMVGNSCVIYLVASHRRMRHVTNFFIASLAVSDALMAVVCIPVTFWANVLLDYWPFPAILCPLVTYFQAVIVFQNAYTMLAMSIERYVAIMHPFLQRLTTKQCFLLIGGCWLLAFGTPVPTAIVSRLVPSNLSTVEENETRSHCYEVWESEQQRFTYSMTIMVLQYFVPLAALIYTYSRIVHVVWLKDVSHHGSVGGSFVGDYGGGGSCRPVLPHRESAPGMELRGGTFVDPRKKVIKMMITVVSIYAICWLPLHVITIVGDTYPAMWEFIYSRYIWVFANWLAMSSCVYNPIIYWWMNPKFREGYEFLLRNIKLYCCMNGRERMNLMLDSRGTYNSMYSQAGYDFPTRIHRGERNGGGGGVGHGGRREDGVGGNDVGNGESSARLGKAPGHRQNGVTFKFDGGNGETFPLRNLTGDVENARCSDDEHSDGGDVAVL